MREIALDLSPLIREAGRDSGPAGFRLEDSLVSRDGLRHIKP